MKMYTYLYLWTLLVHASLLLSLSSSVQAWILPSSCSSVVRGNKSLPAVVALCAGTTASSSSSSSSSTVDSSTTVAMTAAAGAAASSSSSNDDSDGIQVFENFVNFLKEKQIEIIQQLEEMENDTNATFTLDCWGIFDQDENDNDESLSSNVGSGGITRVLQGGNVIEKGACSLTLIQQGILTADRAATLRARQEGMMIQAGDLYAAAALSMVLHSRSPLVPTFRSDVRVFVVYRQNNKKIDNDNDNDASSSSSSFMAWFGGGADLTPYYLFSDDVTFFHEMYCDLCCKHWSSDEEQFSYQQMKKACDDYFYLPARNEYRGTGGIFFDDMKMTNTSLAFVKGVANSWMPSWVPIVRKRQDLPYTEQQRYWQLLRRGRYLEFNLLYDRGVKFGLANANPRVEGVMVSAPPLIAFEYNHQIIPGSEEDKLMTVLKTPVDWVRE